MVLPSDPSSDSPGAATKGPMVPATNGPDPGRTSPGKLEFYGGYQVYSETGIDVNLLRRNLRLTATERLQANCQALPFLEALRQASCSPSAASRISFRSEAVLDLPGMLRQLLDHQVDYVVIGGLAMIAVGLPD